VVLWVLSMGRRTGWGVDPHPPFWCLAVTGRGCRLCGWLLPDSGKGRHDRHRRVCAGQGRAGQGRG
jgi:hypothetical protein